MTQAPTLMDAITSPEFLGLVILAFVLFASWAYLRREMSPPDVEWLHDLDSVPPIELPASRQAELAAMAVPDLWAPTTVPESDPTRSRTTFHKDSNPERDREVRALWRLKSRVVQGGRRG